MKRQIVKTDGGYTVLFESYENPVELTNILDTRSENWGHDDDKKWQGCSRAEAREMVTFGLKNPKLLSKAKRELDQCTRLLVKNKKRKENSVCGYRVNVPRVIQGNPNDMVRRIKRETKDKIVEVVIDATYASYVTPAEASSYFVRAVARVNQLELNGYRVRLSVCNTFMSHNKTQKSHIVKTLLKRENQPLNINRMLFMCAHSGMFRCIGFEWYEKVPEGEYLSGYGTALCYKDKERQEDTLKVITDVSKSYYISYGDDLDEVFKDAKM